MFLVTVRQVEQKAIVVIRVSGIDIAAPMNILHPSFINILLGEHGPHPKLGAAQKQVTILGHLRYDILHLLAVIIRVIRLQRIAANNLFAPFV